MGISLNVTNVPLNSAGSGLASSLSAGQPQQTEQRKQLSIFGHTFYGKEGMSVDQFQSSEGVTAAQHTHEGVLAHERAHDLAARSAGLDTSGPVLQKQKGVTVAGHVSIGIPQFDKARALTDDAYLKTYQRQSQGLVDSATAPERAGIGSYGKMSDADHNVAAMGRRKVQEAHAFEAQRPQLLREQQLKQQMSASQRQQQAAFGYHPGLMAAFNNGVIQ
jgi:hypothetical protein